MSSCQAPYILLGFFLSKGDIGESSSCVVGSYLLKNYAIRQFNVLLWILFIVVTGFLVQKIARLLRFWSLGSQLPGPPCSGFYRNAEAIYKGKCSNQYEDLMEFLSRSHGDYGPIVRLWLGPTQLLVSVKDPKLIKEMLDKVVDKLPVMEKAFRMAFGRSSLFLSAFGKVRSGRKSFTTQLDEKLIARACVVSSKVIDSVTGRLDRLISEGVVDCRSVSQKISFSILGATLFGDSFLTCTKAQAYEELLMMIAKDACFWASYKVPPFWLRSFRRYQQLCKRLKHLTQDMLLECKGQAWTNPADGDLDKVPGNLVRSDGLSGLLISGEFMTHASWTDESYANIMGMMFHGCLTICGLISSVIARLAMHPDIQEKIYAEISSIGMKAGQPDSHEVQKMHFLLATIYESARLLPPGPLLQRCSLNNDLKLNDMFIPSGAILAVPVQLVQTDDFNWGTDATKFNPNRFLARRPSGVDVGDESGSTCETVLNDPNMNCTFLPFGAGARACIGRKFAVLGIATLLNSLLRRYELRLVRGSETDPRPVMNGCILELLPSPNIAFVSRNQ